MIPGIQYSLGVEQDGVYVRYVNKPNQPYDKHLRRKIKSVNDFFGFIKERMKRFKISNPDSLIIMCSSSMDFPHEYTKNKKVIKLANDLR